MLIDLNGLTYEDYRKLIKVFQGTAISEGHLYQRAIYNALSLKFNKIYYEYKLDISSLNVKRKTHRLDILIINEDTKKVLAINTKSVGCSHTIGIEHDVNEVNSYVHCLIKHFSGYEIEYIICKRSNSGLSKDKKIDLIKSMPNNKATWLWDDEFYARFNLDGELINKEIQNLVLTKLKENYNKRFK
ncbi:MAG: hypothetical protein R3321_00305 [Nitrososphaeraceae archaeon]|nr:hypothetical protein [Nitrososphaeraceae archaeon]